MDFGSFSPFDDMTACSYLHCILHVKLLHPASRRVRRSVLLETLSSTEERLRRLHCAAHLKIQLWVWTPKQ